MTVPINLATKYTMTVAAYSGARTGDVVSAQLAETVNRAGHATPVVTAPPGAWVVSHWADKTSLTDWLRAAGRRDVSPGGLRDLDGQGLQRARRLRRFGTGGRPTGT